MAERGWTDLHYPIKILHQPVPERSRPVYRKYADYGKNKKPTGTGGIDDVLPLGIYKIQLK